MGRIGEQVATKTDILQASGAGMPSNRYIDLTLGASGSTYTAPANGYFYLHKQVSGAGQTTTFAYNNNMDNSFAVRFSQPISTGAVAGYIPCKKGTIVGVSYTAGGKTEVFRFYYAEGEI